jgi:hypothetical protein
VDEKSYNCQDGNAGTEPPIEQIPIFQFMTQQKVPVKDKAPVQGKKVVNNQSELGLSEKECERTYQKEQNQLIYRDENFGCGEKLHAFLLMEYTFITNFL